MKLCTCESYKLFRDGCMCGAIVPYVEPHQAVSLLKPAVCFKCCAHLGEELASSSASDAIILCGACVSPAVSAAFSWLDDLPKVVLSAPGSGGVYLISINTIRRPHWRITPGMHTLELDTWLPHVAPSKGDSWSGVDRSVDTSGLAGLRYDGSSVAREEALLQASFLIAREGGEANVCYVHPDVYSTLALSTHAIMGTKFFLGPASMITVKPEASVAKNIAYMLQLDTWGHDVARRLAYCTHPASNCCILL